MTRQHCRRHRGALALPIVLAATVLMGTGLVGTREVRADGGAAIAEHAASRPAVARGATVCDFVAYQAFGGREPEWHPLADLRAGGVDWARIGVTTQRCPELDATDDWRDVPWRGEYWSCLEYAGRVAQIAAGEGMHLCVFLFLSDQAANGARQGAPPEWDALPLPALCRRVERHAYEVARYFADRGLRVEAYELGNEIERGVLGVPRLPAEPPIDWSRMFREDAAWLHEHVWRDEARVLLAAARGIRRANREARLGLHISALPPPNDAFVPAFFEAMAEERVPYDYAALSVYPWVGEGWEGWRGTLGAWTARINALGKPVVIAETSYPLAGDPPGVPGFAEVPLPGCPFSPEGQARYLGDLVGWCGEHGGIEAVYYFYAEHVEGFITGACPGLFLPGEPPRPAPGLAAFGGG
jgi:arabinogalactan endo-1,4-beta-galactosidase